MACDFLKNVSVTEQLPLDWVQSPCHQVTLTRMCIIYNICIQFFGLFR